jgi:O-antigen ligase
VSGTPVALRLAIAAACPVIAALTVVATYLNKELVIAAAWLAFSVGGLLFVQPVVGIAAMSIVYLLDAYPTFLQALGVLSVNNLLGLCFSLLLLAYVLDTRDLSFLRVRQVLLLAVIGGIFFLGLLHAETLFPLLQESRGRGRVIDRTASMTQDFVTRLVFLIFLLVFVRTKRDIRIVFVVFMLSLFAAVPSALVNWAQGNLNRGFRAAASLTAGANPNKLAMICLMEVACWWFWARSRPGSVRRLIAYGACGASLLVLLVTGSRSGLLGAVVLGVLLQTGPRGFRVSPGQIGVLAATAAILIVTVVPRATWERMVSLNPERGEVGASSNVKREVTVERAMDMVRDYPVFGVGLGNFREVSRQVYRDKWFRPPHNSYLWAAAEGGILVLAAYLLLFAITWRDLGVVMRLAHRDHEIAHVAAALRAVFLLLCFFGLFADLWMNPIVYMLIGLVVVMRRYLESMPEVIVAQPTDGRRAALAAA